MEHRKVFSFLNDFVFKYAFGKEKNEPLLICLLNAILNPPNEAKIAAVTLLNPFNLKEYADAKLSVVDVKVQDVRGLRFNIEIQVQEQLSYIARSLYYLSRLFSDQLQQAGAYGALKKTTGIAILGYELFDNETDLHNVFRFRNIQSNEDLTDILEMHFIELPKFHKNNDQKPRTRFEKWLHLLKFGDYYLAENQPLPDDLLKEEGIAMAQDELRRVNADRELRQLMEVREKEMHERATIREEGIEKGIEKERGDLIRKMLGKGKTPEDISELTDISLQEVLRMVPLCTEKSPPKKVSETPRPYHKAKPRQSRKK